MLHSLQGDGFQGFKLLAAQRVDQGEVINLYDFTQSICNSVELTRHSESQSVHLAKPGCTRCGAPNHTRNKCYAKKHRDGRHLTDKAPAKPPQRKIKRSQDEGGSLAKLLESAKKESNSTLSLDQVKTAVARATCLHVKVAATNAGSMETEDAVAALEAVCSVSESVRQDRAPPQDGIQLENLVSLLGLDQQPPRDTVKRACATRVLDSGSPVHIDSDVEVVDHFSRLAITGFNGQSCSLSQGTGTMRVRSGDATIDVSDVHRVNEVPEGILSLARLVLDEGFEFHATPHGAYLTHPNGDTIQVKAQDGIYRLECQPCNYVRSRQQRIDWKKLHVKLGHCSGQALVDTVNNTYGLSADRAQVPDFFCSVCALTKSAKQRISNKRDPATQAIRPWEHIFTDIKHLQ